MQRELNGIAVSTAPPVCIKLEGELPACASNPFLVGLLITTLLALGEDAKVGRIITCHTRTCGQTGIVMIDVGLVTMRRRLKRWLGY
eukprot:5712936-Amphidinium_carterae.2